MTSWRGVCSRTPGHWLYPQDHLVAQAGWLRLEWAAEASQAEQAARLQPLAHGHLLLILLLLLLLRWLLLLLLLWLWRLLGSC
jgi:hypothetical protein